MWHMITFFCGEQPCDNLPVKVSTYSKPASLLTTPQAKKRPSTSWSELLPKRLKFSEKPTEDRINTCCETPASVVHSQRSSPVVSYWQQETWKSWAWETGNVNMICYSKHLEGRLVKSKCSLLWTYEYILTCISVGSLPDRTLLDNPCSFTRSSAFVKHSIRLKLRYDIYYEQKSLCFSSHIFFSSHFVMFFKWHIGSHRHTSHWNPVAKNKTKQKLWWLSLFHHKRATKLFRSTVGSQWWTDTLQGLVTSVAARLGAD